MLKLVPLYPVPGIPVPEEVFYMPAGSDDVAGEHGIPRYHAGGKSSCEQKHEGSE
jgi:hypothetical protein